MTILRRKFKNPRKNKNGTPVVTIKTMGLNFMHEMNKIMRDKPKKIKMVMIKSLCTNWKKV